MGGSRGDPIGRKVLDDFKKGPVRTGERLHLVGKKGSSGEPNAWVRGVQILNHGRGIKRYAVGPGTSDNPSAQSQQSQGIYVDTSNVGKAKQMWRGDNKEDIAVSSSGQERNLHLGSTGKM